MRGIKKADFERVTLRKFRRLEELSSNNKDMLTVKTADIFCDDTLCYGERNGDLLFYDDNHPSFGASKLISKRVLMSLEGLKNQ